MMNRKVVFFMKFDQSTSGVKHFLMSCHLIVAITACLQLHVRVPFHHCFTVENAGPVIRDVTFLSIVVSLVLCDSQSNA